MKKIDWLNEREFMLDGVKFRCELDDYSQKTNRERIIILKNRGTLEPYATMFADAPPRNMLEFGIFQGGSPALFSLWLELDKFVGIDISQPVAAFDEFCRSHDAGRRIRSYYGVSQSDRKSIENIVRTEFDAAPLDVVIDDASHKYSLTRRAFEIAFPLLRPGGMYVIEDWGWAHWAGSRHYMGETALSMLIMEIMMLCASRGDLVSEVRIFPWIAFIRKAPSAITGCDFSLDYAYRKRGIELVGANPVRLRGVAALLAQRIAHSARRRLQRISRRLTPGTKRGLSNES